MNKLLLRIVHKSSVDCRHRSWFTQIEFRFSSLGSIGWRVSVDPYAYVLTSSCAVTLDFMYHFRFRIPFPLPLPLLLMFTFAITVYVRTFTYTPSCRAISAHVPAPTRAPLRTLLRIALCSIASRQSSIKSRPTCASRHRVSDNK
jgi:hypothetical protein